MLEAEYRVALVWYGVGGVESSAQWLVEPLLSKLPYSMSRCLLQLDEEKGEGRKE